MDEKASKRKQISGERVHISAIRQNLSQPLFQTTVKQAFKVDTEKNTDINKMTADRRGEGAKMPEANTRAEGQSLRLSVQPQSREVRLKKGSMGITRRNRYWLSKKLQAIARR